METIYKETKIQEESFEIKPQTLQEYYLTYDSRSIAREIARVKGVPSSKTEDIDQIANSYSIINAQILSEEFPNMIAYSEEQIEEMIKSGLLQVVDDKKSVVCIDRFLLSDDPNTLRFEIARDVSGERTPRQGTDGIEKQIEKLKKQVNNKKIILVDDGMSSGGSIEFTIQQLQKAGLEISDIVIALAEEGKNDVLGIPVTAAQRFAGTMIDWNDERDATIRGGKPQRYSLNRRVAASVPYIPPFGNASGMSLKDSKTLAQTSEKLLEADRAFLQGLEQITGMKITVRDACKAKLPIPVLREYTQQKQKNITFAALVNLLNTPLTELIERALTELQLPQNIIFDMDGTLYNLDGEDEGFNGSRLEQSVLIKAKAYILAKEKCTEEEAKSILLQGLADKVGISNVLAQRYEITREEYFENVWGKINPEEVLNRTDFERTRQTISQLAEKGKKMILLTSAPPVWAKKVLEAAGVNKYFTEIYAGEQFASKEEVFEKLANQYGAENLISIGDQMQTDIEPARKRGMRAFLVDKENPIDYLLTQRI